MNGRRLHEEHGVSLRPHAREMRMTLRHEIVAVGGRVALKVEGALNSGHIPGESEANAGVSWRLLLWSGALRCSSGRCMRRRPDNRTREATGTGNPVSSAQLAHADPAGRCHPHPRCHRATGARALQHRDARRAGAGGTHSTEATMDLSAMPGRSAGKRRKKEGRQSANPPACLERGCFKPERFDLGAGMRGFGARGAEGRGLSFAPCSAATCCSRMPHLDQGLDGD